jgi:hypothetical protein
MVWESSALSYLKGEKAMMFKVVRETQGKLFSAAIKNPDLKIEYIPNQWVESKIGGILVFDNFICAASFANNTYLQGWYDTQVWHCETEEPVELPKFRLTQTVNTSEVEQLWNLQLEDPKLIFRIFSQHLLDYWPEGTKAYRKVKLVEKVYDTAQYMLTNRMHNF